MTNANGDQAAGQGAGEDPRAAMLEAVRISRIPVATMLAPRRSHAPLEVAPCHAHGRPSRDWATLVATGEPITWRVTATGGLVDSSHEGRRARPVLACGALLRLDGVESTLLNPCEGPPYVAVVRRFAVLDGPLAGTCWELHTVEDDASPPDRDHQIPVTPSGTRAQRGPG